MAAAPSSTAPSDEQLARALDRVDQGQLERLISQISRDKPLKGSDRLGFGQGTEFWHLTLTLKDNARAQGLVDDMLGHRGWEVPVVNPAQAIFGVQFHTDGLPPVDAPLAGQLWPGPPPFSDDDATGAPYFDYYRIDRPTDGDPAVPLLIIHDDQYPRTSWGDIDQDAIPEVRLFSASGEILPVNGDDATGELNSWSWPLADEGRNPGPLLLSIP